MKGLTHITDSGNVETCSATTGRCPFASRGHYENPLEAERVSQGVLEDLYYKNVLKSLTTAPVARAEERPLKELNAGDLSEILENIADRNGWGRKMYEAVRMATILHQNQKRYNRGEFKQTPYIEHPLRNAVRISRWGVEDDSVLTAAVLHDVIEDGSSDYARLYENDEAATEDSLETRGRLGREVSRRFGEEELRIVEAVSNDFQESTAKGEQSLQDKAATYKAHVSESLTDSSVMLVKLADFVDNATGLHHNYTPERGEKIYRMAYKYLPVVDVFERKIGLLDGVVSEEAKIDIREQLSRTRERLSAMVERGF